jgi:hypothetical protein
MPTAANLAVVMLTEQQSFISACSVSASLPHLTGTLYDVPNKHPKHTCINNNWK